MLCLDVNLSHDSANEVLKRKSSGKLCTGRTEIKDWLKKEPKTEYKNQHIMFDIKKSEDNKDEEIR